MNTISQAYLLSTINFCVLFIIQSMALALALDRKLKQHDVAMRRRLSLVKCLFNCKNASLITDPI